MAIMTIMTPEKSFLKPHQSVSEILEIFESKNIFGKKKRLGQQNVLGQKKG